MSEGMEFQSVGAATLNAQKSIVWCGGQRASPCQWTVDSVKGCRDGEDPVDTGGQWHGEIYR